MLIKTVLNRLEHFKSFVLERLPFKWSTAPKPWWLRSRAAGSGVQSQRAAGSGVKGCGVRRAIMQFGGEFSQKW